MSIQYLIDENVAPLYRQQLLKRNTELDVYAVGDPGCPARGTLDPAILIWCEENSCMLDTNNRACMPPHLAAHLAQGRHIPGILILNERMSVGDAIDELLLIAEEGVPSAYVDRITFLPVT
jgi:hypothetical protein